MEHWSIRTSGAVNGQKVEGGEVWKGVKVRGAHEAGEGGGVGARAVPLAVEQRAREHHRG